MNKKHILILGSGSAGQRHAKNLASLGCHISAMDPRSDRLEDIAKAVEIRGAYQTLEEALQGSGKIDGFAVTSPPAFHVEQSITALERGIPVFLEKPVSPDESSARKLQEIVKRTGTPLLLGYTYRWWPPLKKVWDLLKSHMVGKLRHVTFVMSAHLADWHPWENYWDFFMASKDLGGGALLDESHWIDLMFWFLGKPDRLIARIDKISDLKIDSDDNVDMVIIYRDGPHVTMHLDLYGRPHQKYIRFVGEEGTILWTIDPNRVSVGEDMAEVWKAYDYDCERNDMFMGVDQEFIEILQGAPVKTCGIKNGVEVLRFIETARKSHSTGQMIEFQSAGGLP